MKNYILPLFLVIALFVSACGGSTATEETLPSPAEAATVELSEEETELLEAAEAAPVEEAAPVTRENYEDALNELEAEIDDEQ